MNAIRGLLNDFIRFSSVDGPGNRFVVFMQGCNFTCTYCHNPYTINTCVDCGICVEPCPEEALNWGPTGAGITVDWSRCNRCEVCVDVCPYDSTPLARWWTVEQLWQEIRATAPFLSGVTVSGGEATLQPEFVADLFARIKHHPDTNRLTTLIDTNGSCTTEVWDRLLPVMDGAMIDLKAFDEDLHIALTGMSNNRVLDSIRYLAARGRLYEVRLLLVPGFNDSEELLVRTARWLREIDPGLRIKVIGFRQHGVRPQFTDLREPTGDEMAGYAQALGEGGAHELVTV